MLTRITILICHQEEVPELTNSKDCRTSAAVEEKTIVLKVTAAIFIYQFSKIIPTTSLHLLRNK